MNRRHEFAGGETPKNSWGEIVFADAVTKLEVLVEHCTKCKRYRLGVVSKSLSYSLDEVTYLEVYVRCWRRDGGIRKRISKWLGISKFKANAT